MVSLAADWSPIIDPFQENCFRVKADASSQKVTRRPVAMSGRNLKTLVFICIE